MTKSRRVAATTALVCATAVCLTTSSCGLLPGSSVGGPTSPTPAASSPVAPPADGNPYLLPDDRKPALFDPCTEIPREVFADPVYGGLDAKDVREHHTAGELNSCLWHNEDIAFAIAATWFGPTEFGSVTRSVKVGTMPVGGRVAEKFVDSPGKSRTNCSLVFYTIRGTVRADGNLVSSIPSFKKQDLGDACTTTARLFEPFVRSIPGGDFR